MHLTLDPAALKERRLRAGLSQDQLAARVGVHRVTVARYETSAMNPNPGTMRRIAKALRCGIDDLARIVND